MSWVMQEGNYPYIPDLSECIEPYSEPYPNFLFEMQEGNYPYIPDLTLIPCFEENYPSALWYITDDLPYSLNFPEIKKLSEPYPLNLWYISDSIPYRISFPKIIKFQFPTALNLPEIEYDSDLTNVVEYDIDFAHRLMSLNILQGTSFSIHVNIRGLNETEIMELPNYELWFYVRLNIEEDCIILQKQFEPIQDIEGSYAVDLLTEDTKNLQGIYSFEIVIKSIENELQKTPKSLMHVFPSAVSSMPERNGV